MRRTLGARKCHVAEHSSLKAKRPIPSQASTQAAPTAARNTCCSLPYLPDGVMPPPWPPLSITLVVLSSENARSQRTYLVYFSPGNPGVIGYYHEFLAILHEKLLKSHGNETTSSQYSVTIHGTSLPGFDCGEKPVRRTMCALTVTSSGRSFSLSYYSLLSLYHRAWISNLLS
jgi:hypothetical protein